MLGRVARLATPTGRGACGRTWPSWRHGAWSPILSCFFWLTATPARALSLFPLGRPVRPSRPSRRLGSPRHGAGAASSLAPLLFAEVGFDKWENQLAPDLKCAAPEIYRSLRSAGATSVRDWLGQNFEGSRRSTEWTDLWNIATRADYALSRAETPSQLALILATDDGVEIDMRRLGAHVYGTRTGDWQGAAAMLAVKAP